MRIEIALNDDFVETAIRAIIEGAKSKNGGEGEIGDGKIFVTPLEECIRIRTEERGGSAI
jgi:nitrogen regulatory protein P-II 1